MVLPRALYVTFYVLYLVMVALVLWFMVHFSDIPAWIYILLVVPLAIFVIGLAVNETVMKGQRYPDGTITYRLNAGWVIFYIIAHIAAFIMFGTGIVLAMVHDSHHWWGWLLFGLGFAFTILAFMLLALVPHNVAWAIVVAILGFIMMVAGAIIVLFFASPEWWAWTVFAVAALLGVLAFIFAVLAEPNVMLFSTAQPEGCGPYACPTVTGPATTTIITAPNAIQTTTTFQQGAPEYAVVHTGEVDANGRAKYVVVHNQPHPGQQTSRIALTGTTVVAPPPPAPVIVQQQPPPVIVQQPPPQPVIVQQAPPQQVILPQQPAPIATTTANFRAPVPQQQVVVPAPVPQPAPVVVPAPVPPPIAAPTPIATATTNYRATALAAPVLPAAQPVVAAPQLPAPPMAAPPVAPLISVSPPMAYSNVIGPPPAAQYGMAVPANYSGTSGGQYTDRNIEITQGYHEPAP